MDDPETRPSAPNPPYHRHIFVCTHERSADNPRGSCGARGGAAIAGRFKAALVAAGLRGTVRASSSGCLGVCERGPCAVVYPDAVWYSISDPARDVDEIVESHVKGDEPVTRCLLERDLELDDK